METVPATELRGPRRGLLAYLACIRYRDVLLLQGSPLMGIVFSMREVTVGTILIAGLFTLASILLVAHIFSFNDWAGITEDLNDPNRAAGVFLTRNVSAQGVLVLTTTLLVASLALLAFLPERTLVLGVLIAGLGIAYSHPTINAKGTPIWSSAPHLVGGVLHFLLGYTVFSPIDARGVLVALFFALTFTAGHLNQEVRDHDADRASGILTNAVRFGPRRAFLAGLLVFTLAYGDLAVLAVGGRVPAPLGVLALVLYPIHVTLSLRTLRAGLTFERVSRFQVRYRVLYAIIGLAMLVTLLIR